jgi:hypothetical protein
MIFSMPKHTKREHYYWKKYHSKSSIKTLVSELRKLRDTVIINIFYFFPFFLINFYQYNNNQVIILFYHKIAFDKHL